MEQEGMPLYRSICTVYISPDGDHVLTYGVEMVSRQRVDEFPDVSVDAAAVQRLVCRLQNGAVDPCHFRDVVLDYIEFLASL